MVAGWWLVGRSVDYGTEKMTHLNLYVTFNSKHGLLFNKKKNKSSLYTVGLQIIWNGQLLTVWFPIQLILHAVLTEQHDVPSNGFRFVFKFLLQGQGV